MHNISTRYSIENDTIYCLKMMNVMEICLMKTAIELCRKKTQFCTSQGNVASDEEGIFNTFRCQVSRDAVYRKLSNIG